MSLKCKDCGTMDPNAFEQLFGETCIEIGDSVNISCDDCCCDRWEAEAPAREERYRERLDAEGYYDDPEGWLKRKNEKRKAQEIAQLGRAPHEWSAYEAD